MNMALKLDVYQGVLLAIAVASAGGTALSITCFLAKHWKRSETERNWMMIASCIAAMVVSYHVAGALAMYGASNGWFYVLLSIPGCALMTLASWFFLLGPVKVAERILVGLDNKLSA